MQSYSQSIPAQGYIVWDVPGKYFVLIGCTNAVDVTFFKQGKQLDLGKVTQILAGMEATLGDVRDTEPAFDRVRIDGTVADVVTIGIGNGQVRYNRSQGNVSITSMPAVPWSGVPQVSISGVASFIPYGFNYGATYKSVTALAANSADTVFTAGSNPNGAILWRAEFLQYFASAVGVGAFVAKATAPTTVIDGDVILGPSGGGAVSTSPLLFGKLEEAVKIPAGKGLFFISNTLENTAARNALYTLL